MPTNLFHLKTSIFCFLVFGCSPFTTTVSLFPFLSAILEKREFLRDTTYIVPPPVYLNNVKLHLRLITDVFYLRSSIRATHKYFIVKCIYSLSVCRANLFDLFPLKLQLVTFATGINLIYALLKVAVHDIQLSYQQRDVLLIHCHLRCHLCKSFMSKLKKKSQINR